MMLGEGSVCILLSGNEYICSITAPFQSYSIIKWRIQLALGPHSTYSNISSSSYTDLVDLKDPFTSACGLRALRMEKRWQITSSGYFLCWTVSRGQPSICTCHGEYSDDIYFRYNRDIHGAGIVSCHSQQYACRSCALYWTSASYREKLGHLGQCFFQLVQLEE